MQVLAVTSASEAQLQSLLQQGSVHQHAGRLAEAEDRYRQALAILPNHPAALGSLSTIASAVGRYDDALKLLDLAISIAPENPNLHLARGVALEASTRWIDALEAYHRVLVLYPNSPEAYNNIGNVLKSLGRIDEAIASYRQAIRMNAGYADAVLHLGHVLKMSGDLAASEAAYRRVLAIDPGRVEVYRLLTMVRRFQSPDDPDIQSMQRHLERPECASMDQMHLHFALGKACDELADYSAALSHWQQANQLMRARYKYDISSDINVLTNVCEVFSQEFFAQRPDYGLAGSKPIFIVGMPRSGSTLVEQILSSHPEVAGAGEVHDLRGTLLSQGHFPDIVTRVDARTVQQMAQHYLDRMQAYNPQGLARITDKELFNFTYIGMIRLMFPDARVICCWRDPVDTCFSIYRQFFPDLARFAYDQYELGRFYGLFRAFMRHWHMVLPGFVLDFHYEQLIDNQEGQTRRLLAYCDLAWDARCLRFHESRRAAKTASATQVRRPLYRGGIGNSRHYEALMGDIKRGLDGPAP